MPTLLLLSLLLTSSPPSSLVSGRLAERVGVRGHPAVVTDGAFGYEGADPLGLAVGLLPSSRLLLPVGAPIAAVVVQAEGGFLLEASSDGTAFAEVLRVDGTAGAGLRTRWTALRAPVAASWVRLSPLGGGCWVSEIQLFSEVPRGLALRRTRPVEPKPPSPLTAGDLRTGKAVVALAGLLALSAALRSPSAWTGACVAIGLGALAFLSFGVFRPGQPREGFVHRWDVAHLVLGARYFPELRYTGLYRCLVAAEVSAGRGAEVASAPVRDLVTGRLGAASSLGTLDPAPCRSRFGEARWSAFRQDAAFFRGYLGFPLFPGLLVDHGYTSSPAWTALARLVTGPVRLSEGSVLALALLDPLLLLLAFALAARAFGLPATAAALLFLSTFEPTDLESMGGAFLRADWLAALVAGLALLKRGRPRVAGVLLGWAAASRVFPGLSLAGLAVVAAVSLAARERERARPLPTLLLAAGSAALVAALLSSWSLEGLSAWREFGGMLRAHSGASIPGRLGLAPALSYTSTAPSLAPGEDVEEALYRPRATALAARRPIQVVLSLAAAGLFLTVARRVPSQTAAMLAPGLTLFLVPLAGYYAGVVLPLLLRWPAGPRSCRALLLLAALSNALPGLGIPLPDRSSLLSAGLLLATAVAWLEARGEAVGGEAVSDPAPPSR